MKHRTAQDTRVRNAREEQTRDYATMPAAQIQHGHDQWGAYVEVDGDEIARLRREHARTYTPTTNFHVIDAGTTRLREPEGITARGCIETTFDPDTKTITVWRDAERSLLGHTPMPAYPPLSDEHLEVIADTAAERAANLTLSTRPYLYYDEETYCAYLNEVAAAVTHPVWCQRQDCWDRSPYSIVTHTRTLDAHQWDYDGIKHTVTAELEMYSETVTPGADDTTDMRVRIASTELGDVTLLGTPEEIRELGRYLVTAADDLEWDLEDAKGGAQ